MAAGVAVRLKQLLMGLASITEQSDRAITGMSLDSRAIVYGDAFVALAGAKQHGLQHIAQAIEVRPRSYLIPLETPNRLLTN
jgi:UDP-N-acetylmuramoyl-L-alanyl-D-glutamate--2,6-diaminopimelate ligase